MTANADVVLEAMGWKCVDPERRDSWQTWVKDDLILTAPEDIDANFIVGTVEPEFRKRGWLVSITATTDGKWEAEVYQDRYWIEKRLSIVIADTFVDAVLAALAAALRAGVRP